MPKGCGGDDEAAGRNRSRGAGVQVLEKTVGPANAKPLPEGPSSGGSSSESMAFLSCRGSAAAIRTSPHPILECGGLGQAPARWRVLENIPLTAPCSGSGSGEAGQREEG